MDIEVIQSQQDNSDPWRQILIRVVAHFAQEAGYEKSEKEALEMMTGYLQALLVEIGRTTKQFTELAGRNQPTVGDVTLALTELGIRIEPVALRTYSRRHGRPILPNPQTLPAIKAPVILSTGKRHNLPRYVPDYFPPLPDPHTYIRIPAHTKPPTDHAECREKVCQQKRDLERSLTRYYTRTSPCFQLFPETAHPPISNPLFPFVMPTSTTYLDALIPKDQIFEEDESSLPPINTIRKTKDIKSEQRLNDDEEGLLNETNNINNNSQEINSEEVSTLNSSWELIDNPFLRPTRKPKKPNKEINKQNVLTNNN